MTLEEFKTLAGRVVFRDWKPNFKAYRGHYQFWWTYGKLKTPRMFIAVTWTEERVIEIMKYAALKVVEIQFHEDFHEDFRVEPEEKTNEG